MQQRRQGRLLCSRRVMLLCWGGHLQFPQRRPGSHPAGFALLPKLVLRTSLEAAGLKPLAEPISFNQTNVLGLTLWDKVSKEVTPRRRCTGRSPRGLQ